MKKLNITKDKFTESKYFQTKYGKLEYVSESGNLYKTSKGHVLKFNEGVFGGYTPDELEDELSKDEKEQEKIDSPKKNLGKSVKKDVQVDKPEIKVGTILCSVWGYSMTLVNFYEVTKRIGKSTLEVVELKQDMTGGGWSGETMPVKGKYVGSPFKVRIGRTGQIKIDSSRYLRMWDGKPQYYNRMDESEKKIDSEIHESNGDSYEMDYYEIDDEMNKICEKYHDQIMTGYDALIQFNREIGDYAQTCQNEIDEAIKNLKVVTKWVHKSANDQFYT